jgi:hypothetical protein
MRMPEIGRAPGTWVGPATGDSGGSERAPSGARERHLRAVHEPFDFDDKTFHGFLLVGWEPSIST